MIKVIAEFIKKESLDVVRPLYADLLVAIDLKDLLANMTNKMMKSEKNQTEVARNMIK